MIVDDPIVVLSLDTELFWGINSPERRRELEASPDALVATPGRVLQLLETHDIPATWAICGHIALQACDEDTCLTAKNRRDHGYSPDWYTDPHANQKSNPLYYQHNLVDQILAS